MTNNITDEIIMEVIDKGLSTLGENPKQATLFCIEKEFNISVQDMPKNIQQLQAALQKLFGLGYNFLDALFRKYLSEALGEDLSKCHSFAESVSILRNQET